jgi:hypothetical protein
MYVRENLVERLAARGAEPGFNLLIPKGTTATVHYLVSIAWVATVGLLRLESQVFVALSTSPARKLALPVTAGTERQPMGSAFRLVGAVFTAFPPVTLFLTPGKLGLAS